MMPAQLRSSTELWLSVLRKDGQQMNRHEAGLRGEELRNL